MSIDIAKRPWQLTLWPRDALRRHMFRRPQRFDKYRRLLFNPLTTVTSLGVKLFYVRNTTINIKVIF
jgi:hypothetical protein